MGHKLPNSSSCVFPPLRVYYDADEEAAEEYGLVILKSVMENGEELLSTLDSDEELDKVYDLFMEQILSDEEE